MKFVASTGAGAHCKWLTSRSLWIKSMRINYWSFQICRTFQSGLWVSVFQCSSQSILLISLLLYNSEWLDTWASARLMSVEREELFGEKDQRPSFCLLPSKSRLKNSPCVSSAAQNFRTKRGKSILLKLLWSRVHDQWIEYRKPWLNHSLCTLAGPVWFSRFPEWNRTVFSLPVWHNNYLLWRV